MSPRAAATILFAFAATSCGEDQDPARARELYARVTSADYTQWARPRNLPRRFASNTRHADESDVYANAVLAAAERGGAITQWPEGSIAVKDGFSSGDKSLLAIMEKTNGAWFFAEYDAKGDTLFSGLTPKVCIDCHLGASVSGDWLYAFRLPR